MKCNKCNKEIPDISKFCLHCGAKVILVCSKCGSTNIPLNSNFCPDCGNPMTKEINYSYEKSTSLKTNCESEIDSIIETCTSKTYNDSNSLRFLEIDADTLKKKIRKTFGKNVSLDETMTIGKVKHLILS